MDYPFPIKLAAVVSSKELEQFCKRIYPDLKTTYSILKYNQFTVINCVKKPIDNNAQTSFDRKADCNYGLDSLLIMDLVNRELLPEGILVIIKD